MKKLLIILFQIVALNSIANAQQNNKNDITPTVIVKEENSDIYFYEEIFSLDNTTKELAFSRAKGWVLENLKTEDNNIQFDEPNSIINSSTILIKGRKAGLGLYANALVNFKLNIQFKDGRYRIKIDDIIVKSTDIKNYPVSPYGNKMVPWKKYNEYLMEEINKAVIAMSKNLNDAIKGISAKDEW